MATSSAGRKSYTPHPPQERQTSLTTTRKSLGALAISSLLPIVTYLFAFLCNDVSGCPAPSLLDPKKLFTPPALSTQTPWQHALDTLAREVGWPGLTGLVSWQALAGTLGWYGLSLALYRILPAQEVKGVELASGGRLGYRLNCELSGERRAGEGRVC